MDIERRSLLLGAAAAALPISRASATEGRPKMLITGHLGNIGSRLLPHYQETWDVIGIDKKDGAEFDLGISNPAWTGRLAGVDTIIHLAATANPYADAVDIHQNNVLATTRLVHAAINFDVRHVVFASSTNASPGRYGNPVGTYGPVTPYGASKLYGEALLENAVRDGKLRSATVIRVGWVPRPDVNPTASEYPHWLIALRWDDKKLRDTFDQGVDSAESFVRIG